MSDESIRFVGRILALAKREGGNPLWLQELIAAAGDALPKVKIVIPANAVIISETDCSL